MALAPAKQLMPLRHRFTVANYHKMARTGILAPNLRVELVEGQIIDMTPIGPMHHAGMDRAAEEFLHALTRRAIVRVQGSVVLDKWSQPQPDLLLLRRRPDFYAKAHPAPADVLLVIEVADSSLPYDRGLKARLHAEASIPEYWIFDIKSKTIIIHREPGPEDYKSRGVARGSDRLGPQAFPDVTFTASRLIGE